MRVCALCGHNMGVFGGCGVAQVWWDGHARWLCHADDHSCYEAWTVYGARPTSNTSREKHRE